MNSVDKICDGCYRMLGDNEEAVGFKIGDSNGGEKVFKGHESCVKEISDTLKELYIGES